MASKDRGPAQDSPLWALAYFGGVLGAFAAIVYLARQALNFGSLDVRDWAFAWLIAGIPVGLSVGAAHLIAWLRTTRRSPARR